MTKPAKVLENLKVVVADDEVAFAALVAEFLIRHGAEVMMTHSGTAAFTTLLSQPIDVLITDLRMPDGTGIELLRKIRNSKSELPKVPRIIVNTGCIDQGESYLFALGADAVLTKPYPLMTLLTLFTLENP